MSVDTEPGSVLDLLRRASKPAAFVVAAAAVITTGVYFYRQSKQAEALRAEQTLFEAQTSLANGNRALAESDLQKLIQRSPNTPAAAQASAQLATLRYEDGKFDEGVALAQRALDKAPGHMKPGLHALLAAGYEDQRKNAEAAAEYRKAAEATEFDLDRQKYLSDAARALMAAGNAAEARKIWEELSTNELSPLSGEARVRLGEMSAKPAGRS
jgi:predicted negative regulator of RcsB-dependent stress response